MLYIIYQLIIGLRYVYLQIHIEHTQKKRLTLLLIVIIFYPLAFIFLFTDVLHHEGLGGSVGSARDCDLTHFILETPKGVLAKSADPDQMPHNVASDLGLHYFASCSTIFQQKYLNQHSQTSLKLKMESSNTYGRRVHSV